LKKFKNYRKLLAILGASLLGLAVLFFAIGITATEQAGGTELWTSATDTWSNTYNSQDQCEDDGWKDCAIASSMGGTTYSKPNQFLIAFSYGLGYFSIAFLSLAGFSSFFIATAESIIEGMGGNIRTKKD